MTRRSFAAAAGLCVTGALAGFAGSPSDASLIEVRPHKSSENDALWLRPVSGSQVENFADGSTGRISEFCGCDGTWIPAYVHMPKRRGPFPVVLIQHGGPPAENVTYTTGRLGAPAASFIEAGWAVVATDFRHKTLPGGGVIEWHDALAAIEALRHLSYIDAHRIAAMAGSHGARVYSEIITRTTLRCAVLCSPAIFDLIELAKARDNDVEEVHPILNAITEGEKRYGATMDVVAQHPECYGYESPMTAAAHVRCPLLLVNGRNDTSSPVSVMEVYAARLKAAGKEVETYFPDNATHGFYFGISHPPRPEETAECARRATAFIRKHFS